MFWSWFLLRGSYAAGIDGSSQESRSLRGKLHDHYMEGYRCAAIKKPYPKKLILLFVFGCKKKLRNWDSSLPCFLKTEQTEPSPPHRDSLEKIFFNYRQKLDKTVFLKRVFSFSREKEREEKGNKLYTLASSFSSLLPSLEDTVIY